MTNDMKILQLDVYFAYAFAVDAEDMPLLSHPDTRAILFARYMRTRLDECRFTINPWSPYKLKDADNDDREYKLDMNKAETTLDFSDVSALPPGFPMRLQPALADAGSFANLFTKRFAPYKKELKGAAPAYITAYIHVEVLFNIDIDEATTFDKEKIQVVDGWTSDSDPWCFMLMYDGKYIPASAIVTEKDLAPGEYHLYHVTASTDIDQENEIPYSETSPISDVFYQPKIYLTPSLPFINDILEFVSHDK